MLAIGTFLLGFGAVLVAPSTMEVDFKQMLIVAAMNPGAILTGFFIGRKSDQVQKVIVGAFVAGFVGLAFVWMVSKFGLYVGNMNSVGGVFALSFLVGLIWSYIGFKTRRAPG